MNVEVVRNGAVWEVWERTHGGGRLLVRYRRKGQAVLVAKFYADVMAHVLNFPVVAVIEDRKGNVTRRVICGGG